MSRAWLAVTIGSCLLPACSSDPPAASAGGDAQRGRLMIEQYACGTCHEVPGVRRATGTIGPPLVRYAHRPYIAGEIANDPELLVRFLQDPQALVPGTTMTDLGVPEAHARDMGAYLMGLR